MRPVCFQVNEVSVENSGKVPRVTRVRWLRAAAGRVCGDARDMCAPFPCTAY